MDKCVVAVFSILWLGTLACAIALPFAINGAHIGPTDYCLDANVKAFGSAGMVASTIYDTLVFLAISWKLSTDSMTGSTFGNKVKLFFGGRALPTLSRGLLQSGQVYYL